MEETLKRASFEPRSLVEVGWKCYKIAIIINSCIFVNGRYSWLGWDYNKPNACLWTVDVQLVVSPHHVCASTHK